MTTLRPQLVMGENNQVCMQLKLGQYSATLPLPEALAGASKEQLQEFFDHVVPGMTEGLLAMKRKDDRKRFRRSKGAIG